MVLFCFAQTNSILKVAQGKRPVVKGKRSRLGATAGFHPFDTTKTHPSLDQHVSYVVFRDCFFLCVCLHYPTLIPLIEVEMEPHPASTRKTHTYTRNECKLFPLFHLQIFIQVQQRAHFCMQRSQIPGSQVSDAISGAPGVSCGHHPRSVSKPYSRLSKGAGRGCFTSSSAFSLVGANIGCCEHVKARGVGK